MSVVQAKPSNEISYYPCRATPVVVEIHESAATDDVRQTDNHAIVSTAAMSVTALLNRHISSLAQRRTEPLPKAQHTLIFIIWKRAPGCLKSLVNTSCC